METPRKVIIFDFFGVICAEIVPPWLAKVFPKQEADHIRATLIRSADMGEISQKELFAFLGELAHMSPEQVEKDWWSYVVIDPHIVKTIEGLRDTYTIALLTNAPAPFVRGVLAKHDLSRLFDEIIVSAEEHCAKPQADIYQLLLKRLFVQPKDTFMIDDNMCNIQGARDVGIDGLVFTSEAQLKTILADRVS